MKYEYHYAARNEPKLKPFLAELEHEFPGARRPWGIRGGAIDLVTVLEIMIGGAGALTLKTVGGKYLEGLLDTDSIKAAGARHRDAVLALTVQTTKEIRALGRKLLLLVENGLREFSCSDELAVTLVFHIDDLSCYVVLNQDGADDAAVEGLPLAIDTILELYVAGSIPADAHCAQLFYENESSQWSTLFVPTNDGYGNHIDRYVDLRDGSVHGVRDADEFVRLFAPSSNDKLKFLVTPFRDVRRSP